METPLSDDELRALRRLLADHPGPFRAVSARMRKPAPTVIGEIARVVRAVVERQERRDRDRGSP
jgi:hypothetical protein